MLNTFKNKNKFKSSISIVILPAEGHNMDLPWLHIGYYPQDLNEIKYHAFC